MEAGAGSRVARVHFERMALGEPDESGRRRPVSTGEEFAVEATTVVVAIGYRSDEELAEQAKVAHSRDLIVVDPETFETSRPGVFAGGDCVNGADLVVTAIADGRRAAAAIHQYLLDKAEAAA
jgi:glutamate synthase (NADPH/NADH) small chain